jgi:hypothetical protein
MSMVWIYMLAAGAGFGAYIAWFFYRHLKTRAKPVGWDAVKAAAILRGDAEAKSADGN